MAPKVVLCKSKYESSCENYVGSQYIGIYNIKY